MTGSLQAETAQKMVLVATPSAGPAPLVVTFSGHGSGRLESVVRLDFGDGEVDNTISPIRAFTRTHTYAAPGTYVAELLSGDYGGQQPAELSTVASVAITVR